jgi:hypothetical protein
MIQTSNTPGATYAGRDVAVVTLFLPREDFAYVRLPVQYLRVDWAPGAVLGLRGPAGRPVVLPERGRTVSVANDGGVSLQFDRPGQWVVEWPGKPRVCVFVDPPDAWPVTPGARHGYEFGIRPDADRPQTAALNAALLALSEAGGGVLALGPGLYRTGTVVLRSRVTLYLHEGAVLQAADELEEFPLEPEERINRALPPSLIPGARRRLILGEGVEHAAILGRGVICGNGSEWRRRHVRPRWNTNLVRLVDSHDVRIEGVILRDSEQWSVHLLHCRDVDLRWVKLVAEIPPRGWDAWKNPGSRSLWNNADGINPDSSQRVRIEDSFFHTGDDCVPVKNTSTWQGRLDDVREIVVRRACMISSVTALKIGTETLGGAMEDIVFEDIDVVSCGRALAIDMKDGATARRIAFRDVRVHRCNRPFDFWIIRRDDEPAQQRFSRIRDVLLERVEFRRMRIEPEGWESHLFGLDADHRIEGVCFREVRWLGEPLRELKAPDVHVNEHVAGVIVETITQPRRSVSQ